MGHHHTRRCSCGGHAANSRLFLFCPVRACASACCCRCRPHISEKEDRHKFKMGDVLKCKLMSQISERGYAPAATLLYLRSSGRSFQSSPAEDHIRNPNNGSCISLRVQLLRVIHRFYFENFLNSTSFALCLQRANPKPRREHYQVSVELIWLSNH